MSQHHFTRRNFIKATSLALPLVAAGCAVSHRQAARVQDFVTVRQGRFERRGRPYFYLGANMWFGCYLGDRQLAGGRARLRRELDRLKLIGATNVRLLGGSESSPLTRSIAGGITRGPHDWDEELLVGLDFCLAEMARRDMTAVMISLRKTPSPNVSLSGWKNPSAPPGSTRLLNTSSNAALTWARRYPGKAQTSSFKSNGT